MTSRLKADLALFLVAIIWGFSFAIQRLIALEGLVLVFNGLRFLLGAVVLLPFVRVPWRLSPSHLTLIVLAGTVVFIGSYFQQAGMKTTSTANAGFITGLYVVIVPLVQLVGWKEKPRILSLFAVLLAAGGTYLLSSGGLAWQFHYGDLLELAGAIFWALHVVIVSRAALQVNVLLFSAGQYAVCGILSCLAGFFVEKTLVPTLLNHWWGIVFTGLFSIGIGFTLQVFAQRHTPATEAALILSGETVMAALFGFVLLGEKLNLIQLMGCGLILTGIVIVQIKKGKQQVPI